LKRILISIPLLLALTVVSAILAFNAGLFHKQIEDRVVQATGGKAQLGKIQLAYRWPPFITVEASHLEHPLADIRWNRLQVEVLRVFEPYALRVRIEQPKVQVKIDVKNSPAGPTQPSAGGTGGGSKPMSLWLEIAGGDIESPIANVSGLNLRFEQRQLLKSVAKIHAQATVRAAALPVPLPVKVDSDSLTLSEDLVKTSALSMSVGGLSASVQGTSLLKDQRHRWLLDLSAPDLSKLPEPPVQIPAKGWKGAVRVKGEVGKDSAGSPWHAEGEIDARGVGADVQFKHDKIDILGPVSLEAQAKFSYLNEKPNVQNLNASLNLSSAHVEYQGMISKAAGVPLTAKVEAQGSPEKLSISTMELKIWDLTSQVKGSVELKAPWPGQVDVVVQPVNLAGAEKWLIPLRASPVQGQLALKARVNGPLADPMQASVFVDDLKLKDFSATVEYEKPGLFQVRGPVMADVEANGEWSGGKVKSAEGKGGIDLGGAAMTLGPLRKEARAKFHTRFGVRNSGQDVVIDSFTLESFFGNLAAKGSVKELTHPVLDLNVEYRPLLLSELRVAIPEYRDKIPKGSLSGSLSLKGKPDFAKAWSDWPVAVSGGVNAVLPEYVLAPSAPAAKPGAPPPAGQTAQVEPAASFLPKGELTQKLNLGIKASVAVLKKDATTFEGVSFNGAVSGGRLKGQASIQSIFKGSAEVSGLNIPMLEPNPIIQGTAVWKNLDVREVILFTKPEFKDFASGLSAGTTEFTTPLPGGADFLSAVKARGEMKLSPVTFSTVKVGQMINDMLAKVPMIKAKPAKVEPLKGTMNLKYEMKDGVVNVVDLEGTDLDGNEIQMKGKVTLASLQGDLVGTFAWSDPQVKGCFMEGNADAKGRMVIPLGIKGDLMSPGMSLLSDMAQKLGAKALECEKKKLVEKVKDEGKQKLEQEGKKLLKKLFK
jgi:hypothetical protein